MSLMLFGRCLLHDFGRWDLLEAGELQKRFDVGGMWIYGDSIPKPSPIGNYIVQFRDCRRCGKKQLRTITAEYA